MKTLCDACRSKDIYTLYEIDRLPVFLNKVYPTREAAMSCATAGVRLVACGYCGLVFNARFENAKMDYDKDYIQSQGHSASFQRYTQTILDLFLEDIDIRSDKVVEIGCGREAYFLNMLLNKGVDITGFDPVYEGDNPHVTKAYFDREAAVSLQVRAVIVRHTLELIEKPLDLLLNLKAFLPPETLIFIESPSWEWILEKNAFWDISHEICNYFSRDFFQRIFSGKATIHQTFAGQYLVVKARLSDLTSDFTEANHGQKYKNCFDSSLSLYRDKVKGHARNYVWGAAAKGAAFVNALDPKAEHIQAVIDINSNKQGCFLPLTGHSCVAPSEIPWKTLGRETCLWIMNENYKQEILAAIPEFIDGEIIVLGETSPLTKAA